MRVAIAAVVLTFVGTVVQLHASQSPVGWIDEGFFADVHGVEQWVTLRAA